MSLWILVACGVILTALLNPVRGAEQSSVEEIAKAINAFGVNLYREFGSEPANIVVSPFSIHTALAMSYAGARGATAREMAGVLQFTEAARDIHAGYRVLLKGTTERSRSGCEIVVANSLFAQSGYLFLKPFQELLRDNYDGSTYEVDLTGSPGFDPVKAAAARKQINNWIADKTRGKISQILPSTFPDPDTRLMLVNAVWFKGKWATQFQKAATADAPFYLATEGFVTVPMMNLKANFAYADWDDVQILQVPYTGEHFSMVFCLPKNSRELAAIEKSLSFRKIEKWSQSIKLRKVMVSLPRFRLVSELELNAPLGRLGLKQSFSDSADFSGITPEKPFYIKAALHKAYVDVDEEGTEAAASTVIIFDESSVADNPIIFNANHPFLFLIRDNHTGLILFIGRVADPSKE